MTSASRRRIGPSIAPSAAGQPAVRSLPLVALRAGGPGGARSRQHRVARPECNTRDIIAAMTQQFARIPSDAGAVVREVRGFGGVPWARLFGYLRPHWRPFSLALVGLVISSAVGLAFPLIIAGVVTTVVAGGDAGGLDALIVMLVALFLVQAAGGFLQTYLLGVVGERVVAQLRGELFGRLITLSLDFHTSHRVGELISRLSNDVTLVRTMLTQTVTSLLSSLIGLVGSVVILFTLSPTLLLVILLLAPALIVVAVVFGRPLQRVSTQVQDTIAGSTTTAEEALSGIRVVKSYVREDWELERYDRDLRTVVATGSRLALWRALFGMLMGFLGFGAIAALLWYTGHQVIDGTLGIGTLTGFLLYGVAIGASLGSLASLYGQFREGTGAIERVFEIIDTRPTVLDAPDARPLGTVAGRVELDDVSFAYLPDRPVVREVSLTIAAGETLALVGPSGSGKTTLVGLIPRLWDVTSGAIRVDGVDVRDVTVDSLRGQIGLVAQEATLFGGTVRENILYGRLDATEADMVAAAVAANAHDFISVLPDRLRHGGRRPRHAAVGRSAPARGDRPGDPQGPADPAARRGDELARQRVRAAGPGGARPAQGGAHDDHRGPPTLDDPRGGPDRGAGRRLAGRARDAGRAAGARRAVRAAASDAVRAARGRGAGRGLTWRSTWSGSSRPRRACTTGRCASSGRAERPGTGSGSSSRSWSASGAARCRGSTASSRWRRRGRTSSIRSWEPRLRECVGAVLATSGVTAEQIFGSLDAMKVRSSMTLFHRAAPDEPLFTQMLGRFYGGTTDEATEAMLR